MAMIPPETRARTLGLAERPLGPPTDGWITSSDFYDAALTGKPYRVRALFAFGSNLLVSHPAPERGREALKALDFQVHCDLFLNPTAEMADIVLPVSSPWEHEALRLGFEISPEAQIVDLQDRLGLSYLFIAHDLAVVRAVSTRIAVMYAGSVVETATKAQLYTDPQHPYSRALLDAVPRADPDLVRHPVVAGEVPSLLDPPPGCSFHPRCPFTMERCRVELPLLKEYGAGRRVACHLFST